MNASVSTAPAPSTHSNWKVGHTILLCVLLILIALVGSSSLVFPSVGLPSFSKLAAWLVAVLVFACAYWRITDEEGSASTIRRRGDEWIEAGVESEAGLPLAADRT